jgi:hypothetical protein
MTMSSLVDAKPNVDITEAYADLWKLLAELKDKVFARFELQPDPSTAEFATYGGPEGPRGELTAYVGPEVDWAVHSWLGNPQYSFSNMHLTVWLGPQVKVPHLGIAFGTMPDLWCYLDYVPRSDLMVDLEALDTYYEPTNEQWLALRARDDVGPFISRALYVREALSETAVCFSAAYTPELIARLSELAHAHVDRWLAWVDAAAPTPEDERAPLATRDEAVRRNVAERDPANEMGVRYFGQEMTDRLVAALWGGGRALPRPGA